MYIVKFMAERTQKKALSIFNLIVLLSLLFANSQNLDPEDVSVFKNLCLTQSCSTAVVNQVLYYSTLLGIGFRKLS